MPESEPTLIDEEYVEDPEIVALLEGIAEHDRVVLEIDSFQQKVENDVIKKMLKQAKSTTYARNVVWDKCFNLECNRIGTLHYHILNGVAKSHIIKRKRTLSKDINAEDYNKILKLLQSRRKAESEF